MTTLYHFTCDHGMTGIAAAGEVRPHVHPSLGVALSWWTDLDSPIRDALGLTSYLLRCDRTAHRVAVTGQPVIQWWPRWARLLPREVRDELEAAPGAMPAHWYVAGQPVPVAIEAAS